MKVQALNLRIRRLVLDSPPCDGVTADALGAAVRTALAAQNGWSAEQGPVTPQSHSLAPLAGSIAAGVSLYLDASAVGPRR
jgi:hypothetical protein